MKSHKTTNYGDKSLTMLGPKVWINSPKILNQNLVLVYLRNILILGSDSDTNATLHFDIIYENGGQNGENNYRVDPFQKMQVDEMKCRFTKMISSLVVLTVLPSRLLIFLRHLFCILYVFTWPWSLFTRFEVFIFVSVWLFSRK